MPTLEELLPESAVGTQAGAADLTSLPPTHRRYRYFSIKNKLERALGIGLLIPALPVIVVCWTAVRLTSKGPGIYRQTRVGYRGETFQVLKLRTMRIDAEANGPQWSSKGDPRITPLGRILRTLHLDELPQLVNVARGEMVLVGPRPERPEFVELLSKKIPGYQRRLIVKPGITGLSQINLPPDTDLRSVERKQVLDLYHIDHAHPWLDSRMVALTALRVMCISSERLTQRLGLCRKHLLRELPEVDSERGPVTLQELLMEAKQQEEWADESVDETWDDEDSWSGNERVVNQPR